MDLLKINKDLAPQSHEIFKTFVLGVGGGGGTNFGGHRVCKQKPVTFRNFADLYRRTKDVSLSNLAPLLILWGSFQWCRQIFPNWSMSKVEKTVEAAPLQSEKGLQQLHSQDPLLLVLRS